VKTFKSKPGNHNNTSGKKGRNGQRSHSKNVTMVDVCNYNSRDKLSSNCNNNDSSTHVKRKSKNVGRASNPVPIVRTKKMKRSQIAKLVAGFSLLYLVAQTLLIFMVRDRDIQRDLEWKKKVHESFHVASKTIRKPVKSDKVSNKREAIDDRDEYVGTDTANKLSELSISAASSKTGGNALCSVLPKSITSASTLWGDRLRDILAASQHPDDPQYSHKNWTESLLAELSPTQLGNAVVSEPLPDQISKVLNILKKRLESSIESKYEAKPLLIAVLGGAITEGDGCDLASVPIPTGSIMGNPTYCAWPYRLESFVNTILGFDAVKISNMAEDGTSTLVKTPLLKYWMYPDSLLPEGPDIIIHAYSSTDALPFEHENESLADTLRRELRAFIKSVKYSRPCGNSPLVLYMDDSGLIDEKLMKEGNLMSISYSKPVSRVAKVDSSDGILNSEVPFGMAGHISIAWVLAFAMVDAFIKHCGHIDRDSMPAAGESISDVKCQDSPCIIAWMAPGTTKRPKDINDAIEPFITENVGWRAMSDISTGYFRKVGLIALEPNATISIEYQNIPQDVRVLTLMIVQSYGDKWLDSRARFTLMVNNSSFNSGSNVSDTGGVNDAINENGNLKKTVKYQTQFDIEGTHQMSNHITFPFELNLESDFAVAGDDLLLKIDLIGGRTFKIIGMMFCNR